MMCALRKFLRNRTGVASVEMALMLPVLFAFMFTTFEGGYYLWTEHKVIKGVRQGARYAARLPFSNFACSSAGTVTSLSNELGADVYDDIRNVVVYGNAAGTGHPKVRGWTRDDISISIDCDSGTTTGLYKTKAGGAARVLVNTVVDYPAIYGLLGFDTGALKVRAQAQAAVAGA